MTPQRKQPFKLWGNNVNPWVWAAFRTLPGGLLAVLPLMAFNEPLRLRFTIGFPASIVPVVSVHQNVHVTDMFM